MSSALGNRLKMKQVCVIGAGISGLSTATCLQQRLGNQVQVTIVSDKFSPDTTGDGAAGIIELHSVADTPLELQRRWCRETLNHCLDIYNTADAKDAGICAMSAYMISYEREDPEYKDFVFDYRWLTDDEFRRLFPLVYKEGLHCLHLTTLICECRMYLPYLMKQFKSAGGKIVQRKVFSFSELADYYDVIVNCSGLNARQLANDPTVKPLRGQSLRVTAPWIKSGVMFGDYYILPCANNVMVGGTHQLDDWRTEPCEKDKKRILENGCKFFPSLKHATVQWEWVGLRPTRPTVRVEAEMIRTANKRLPVVHNYGHGGAGISLHWGTANDTTTLVVDTLDKLTTKSKL